MEGERGSEGGGVTEREGGVGGGGGRRYWQQSGLGSPLLLSCAEVQKRL